MSFVMRERSRALGAGVAAPALFVCVLAALLLMPVNAEARRRHQYRDEYSPPASAMVVDVYTGRILYAKNANELRFPASLTKVMTLYLLFDALRDGKLTMHSKLRVSEHASDQSPTKLGLSPGDAITVADAIGAIVTKSANDIAVTVAEALAGSEEEFARKMTQKARTIGMLNTTFRNASGLPNPDQKTTAQDLIILGKSIIADHPENCKVFSTKYFQYDGEIYRNHNTMLFSYEGMEGMKTGFTTASGFNLLATAHRGERRLLAVVLGGSSAGARNAAMRNLLDASWAKAMTLTAARKSGALVAAAKPKAAEPPQAKAKSQAKTELASAKPAKEPAPKPAAVASARPSRSAQWLGRKADRTSISMIIASIESGLHARASSSASQQQAAAASDATTDEPEDKAERAASQGKAYASPPAQEVANNETRVAHAQPARLQNVSVHYKTVRQPEVEPLDAVSVDGASPPEPKSEANSIKLAEAAPPDAKRTKAESVPHAVEPEEPKKPQTLAAAAVAASRDLDQPGPFHVQVGAFPNEEQAQERLQSVREALGSSVMKAHPEFIMTVALPTGVTMFRARLSRFASEAQAKSTCKLLKRSGFDCWDIHAH
jgi:D-alanyl-D-alanine carboxypeptidase